MIYRYKSFIMNTAVVAMAIFCAAATLASAKAGESVSGEYNACLAKFKPVQSVTNHTLVLEDSGKLSLLPDEVRGKWTTTDGKIRINLDDGRSYGGCVGDGFMALTASGGGAETFLAARQSANKSASCYTMSGEVYNPFSYNTLCVIDKESSTGNGQVYWCDESIRFMFRLECNDSIKSKFRGFPRVESSGLFHVGMEPPAGAGEKGDDLQGFTTEDGSLFCAAGKLAANSKNPSPVFSIGLKRQPGAVGELKLRFRLVSVGSGWPDDSVLQLSGEKWSITSGGKTIDGGKILQAKNSLCVLRGSQHTSMTALIDSARRVAVVKRNQQGDNIFAIGFLEDAK